MAKRVTRASASSKQSRSKKESPSSTKNKASSRRKEIPSDLKSLVEPFWVLPHEDPYEMFEWKTSHVHLSDYRTGKTIYENDVEHPINWSQNAVDTTASKYLRRADIPGIGGENSIRQLIHRVATCLANWGVRRGYFSKAEAEIFYKEVVYGFLSQRIGFNSPVWFNYGLHEVYGIKGASGRTRYCVDSQTGKLITLQEELERPGGAACFLSAVDDSLFNEQGSGMFDHLSNECRVFLTGAGDGFNASSIRGKDEPIEGGGVSAGLISYLKVRDSASGYIKSGGKTRRSATLICLNDDHPDIVEFIEWKGKEEKKAHALIDAGWPSDFEGEAYSTVSGQNSNNSIRCSNAFMHAIEDDADWFMVSRREYSKFRKLPKFQDLIETGKCGQGILYSKKDDPLGTAPIAIRHAQTGKIHRVMQKIKARELWDLICKTAHECGCPGIQFDDTINEWNTVPHYGRITTTNPCFSGQTLIPTRDGLVRIEDWAKEKTKREIWSNNRWIEAKSFPTKVAETITLHFSNGYRITCTPDHRFQLIDGTEVIAEDTLDQQVMIVVPEPILSGEHDPMSVILGFMQGDGSYHEASGYFKYVNIGEKDEDVREFFQANNVKLSETTKSWVFGIEKSFGQGLNDFLKSVALPLRDLRDEVLTMAPDQLAAFLRGLYSANGCVMAKYNRVSLKTTCGSLARQVQQALVSLGIKSYITTNEPKMIKFDNGTYECRESYDVNITSDDCVAFAERIGFIQKYKTAELKQIVDEGKFGRRLHPRVIDIVPGEIEQVYDFTLLEDLEDEERWACVAGTSAHNCAEVCLPDWSVCNLGSVNLIHFFADMENPDWVGYEHACNLMTVALDLVVEISSYPTKMHAQGCYQLRSIGENHGNIGAVLMRNGMAYDSDEARAFMSLVTSAQTLFAWETSHAMAERLGSYPAYDEKNHRKIVRMHAEALENVSREHVDEDALNDLKARWREMVEARGFRNNTVTCLVPQGTIGLVLDQDTMGCEPDFALVKQKKCVGGHYMKIVNGSVEPALRKLSYTASDIQEINNYVLAWGTIEGAPHIKPEHVAIFDTAVRPQNGLQASAIDLSELPYDPRIQQTILAGAKNGPVDYTVLGSLADDLRAEIGDITEVIKPAKTQKQAVDLIMAYADTQATELNDRLIVFNKLMKRYGNAIRIFTRVIHVNGHIDALAAFQPHISMSISKTVNMDSDATVADVQAAYMRGWKKGVKCVAIYVDGSKKSQPLNAGASKKDDTGKKSEKKTMLVDPASNQGLQVVAVDELPEETRKFVEKAQAQQETWRATWPAKRRPPVNYTNLTDTFKVTINDPTSGRVSVFIHVDRYPETNDLMHLFVDMGKQGETVAGLLDSMSRIISISAQHGVPIDQMGEMLEGMAFGPRGMLGKTSIFGIRFVHSIPDLLGRLLQQLPAWWAAGRPEKMLYPSPYDPSHPVVAPVVAPADVQTSAPAQTTPVEEEITSAPVAKRYGYTGNQCKKCGSFRTVGSNSCFNCKDCGEYNGPCGS